MHNRQRQNEKCHGGADSAAFSCNFDVDAREVEDKPLSKNGNSGQVEENLSDFCGTSLQQRDDVFEQKIWQRNSEKKKKKREVG